MKSRNVPGFGTVLAMIAIWLTFVGGLIYIGLHSCHSSVPSSPSASSCLLSCY